MSGQPVEAPAPPVSGRAHPPTAAIAVLVGTGLLVALLLVVASPAVDFISASGPRSGGPIALTPPPPSLATTAAGQQPPEPGLPPWIGTALYAAALVAALAVAYLLARLVRGLRLRRRLGRRPGPLPDGVPNDALPDVPEELGGADAAYRRRDLLTTGQPRNAVVACWADLEEAAAATGLGRDPAETSTEYVVRVLHGWDVNPRELGRLAALYREARFSTHPMGEPAREQALAALDAVHADLARLRASGETPTAAGEQP
ncbi:MAG TPA: DUF4129 domain-containing protein [Dermatophilaceae bacterium]|nr:DUF4129 domain-containing protein [Dermatophilaceae bacterium]